MTQPVGTYRSEWFPDLVGPPPPPTLPGATPPSRGPAVPADSNKPTDDAVHLEPVAVGGAEASQNSSAIVAAQLDAFLLRATPTFGTSEGWATVAITFRMTTGGEDKLAQQRVDAVVRAGLPRSVSDVLVVGRASPEVVARVTQSLIDMGHLPAQANNGSTAVPDRIRLMMLQHHIGIDCAGYVQQASLLARGLTRVQAGFVKIENEDLSNLGGKGFARVKIVGSLRPGDIFVLKPDENNAVGHRAIVRTQRPASRVEIEGIRASWQLPASAAPSQAWSMVVVDGSWGGFGDAMQGGVERRTWWHDATSGIWAWVDGGVPVVTAGPYRHSNFQMYTPKEPK
jgi:hypothetical protein